MSRVILRYNVSSRPAWARYWGEGLKENDKEERMQLYSQKKHFKNGMVYMLQLHSLDS